MLLPRPTDLRQAFGRLSTLPVVAVIGLTLTAALLLLGTSYALGQDRDVLQADYLKPGESSLVLLHADSIATWQEGTEKVYLLRGKVWVEQGPVSLRLEEGVVWVKESDSGRAGRTCLIELYGEGSATIPATLQDAKTRRTAGKIHMRLATTGKITGTSWLSKVQETNLAGDPFFQWAAAQRRTDIATIVRAQVGTATPPVVVPAPPLGAAPNAQPGIPFVIVPAPGSAPTTVTPGSPQPADTAGPSPLPPPAASPFEKANPAAVAGKPTGPAPERIVSIRPGTAMPFNTEKRLLPNGELATIINSRVIIWIRDAATNKTLLDMEADRIVVWDRGDRSSSSLSGLNAPEGRSTKSMEFYLAGNVQVRNQQGPKEVQILRAQEVYYDVGRNVAIALKADVEFQSPKTVNPAHFKANEVIQTGPKEFEGHDIQFSISGLPSDPGLFVAAPRGTLTETDRPMTTIFGLPYYSQKTGEQVTTPARILTAESATINLEGIPVFWFPFLKTDANKPLGPLEAVGFNYNTIFGLQLLTTWSVFDLIGIVPEPGKKWDLYMDELTARGPHLGTMYRDAGKNFFGLGGEYEALLKLDGMIDGGSDTLGGDRGSQAYTGPNTFEPINNPELRGRSLLQFHLWDLPNGFTFLGEYAQISDRNYLEQYMSNEWLTGPNEETFAYLKQQQNSWAWSILAEDRIRPWITETNWLPKGDGWLIGFSPLEFFSWDTHASAGYAQLQPTTSPSFAYDPTDVRVNTGRLDWWNEFSTVFALGDLKVMPYAVLDLTYYSADIAGNEIGRVYGGGGLRSSLPLSKLYPDIQSELFNLDGIFHKIVFSGNYFYAQTNVHYNQLPQLDQLNDNTTDQALRDIFPRQSVLNPANAFELTTSKLFDPQMYAVRTLLANQVDTLDDIDVLQLDIRQRWQTKQGFPGSENVVDWMVLDLSASIFPQANRDNFGQPIGLLQYDWLWNVGDRTAVFSNGWFEPESGGPRVFNIGATISRPDKSSFTLSYRQIDPLDSKAVIGAVTYPLSAKYAITGSVMYDFGVNTQVNTIMLTRIGTDLRFSFGFSYNSILNNFGVMMEIVPNMFPSSGRGVPGMIGMPNS